ncbi:MAG: hypothetical protein ACFFG0_35620 [Candidatus Thorarchaeota archaeon]
MNDLQILMAGKIKKRIEKIVASGRIIADDCNSIISYSYQWCEAGGRLFPSIKFYRNWSQHPKLDRGEILRFFKKLYKQFSICESIESSSDYIAKQLSLKKLRCELKNVFKNINCNFPILDSLSQCKQFMGCFCNELLNKPLEIKIL